jgi:hypothetical protein
MVHLTSADACLETKQASSKRRSLTRDFEERLVGFGGVPHVPLDMHL